MNDFEAFQNDTQSLTVGPGDGLVFENGQEVINIYGDIDISKNTSIKEIDDLINILSDIKKTLKNK